MFQGLYNASLITFQQAIVVIDFIEQINLEFQNEQLYQNRIFIHCVLIREL
jgi:hypothetical protein